MKNELEMKITEYWHLSHIAGHKRYDRAQLIKKWLLEHDMPLVVKFCQPYNSQQVTPNFSMKKLWLLIEDVTTVF